MLRKEEYTSTSPMVRSILWHRPLGRVSNTNPLVQMRPKLNSNREGHLRHKIKRWRDLEAGQWRQAVSMQLHHNSRMSFFSARETQSAPTGSVLMPTSSLGIGEGQVGVSMASSYVVYVFSPSILMICQVLTLLFLRGPLSGRPLVPSGTNTNYGSNNFGIRNSYTNNVLPNSINAIGSTTQLNYDDGYGAPQGTPPSAVMGPCLCPYCDEPDTEGDHYSCALFM
jgi:hypothetical protein